jgi:hypothetical protein
MKIRNAVLLVPVLLALCVGTAVAKPAPRHAGVDPYFGHAGTTVVSVPKGAAEKPIQLATGSGGVVYVLSDGLLFDFGPEGRLDRSFGTNGRIRVAAAAGETTEVTGLAVDAKGRILLSGSVNPTPGVPSSSDPTLYNLPAPSNAFVVRYLPDGERDSTFGGAGEIDVTLTPPASASPTISKHADSPIVVADRLTIVNGEQPVLGGTYWYWDYPCYSLAVGATAFVAPIDPAGAAVQNLAPTAYTEVPQNNVAALAPLPAGNLTALSDDTHVCGHTLSGTSSLTKLSYGSTPAPALDPSRPQVALSSLAVDGKGRFLGLEGPEVFPFDGTAAPWKLMRLLPNGDFDLSFGFNGGFPLKKFGEEAVGGLAVDSKGRAVVAGGNRKFRLVRLRTNGTVDHGFGSHGWVEVGFGRGSKASPDAVTIDPKGRIVAAGPVTSSALKTGVGIGLTRILPGS